MLWRKASCPGDTATLLYLEGTSIERMRLMASGCPPTAHGPVIEVPSQRRGWWSHVNCFNQETRSDTLTTETCRGCTPSQKAAESTCPLLQATMCGGGRPQSLAALMRDQCSVPELGTSFKKPNRFKHQGTYLDRIIFDRCH